MSWGGDQANRGQEFEELIGIANGQLRSKGLAVVHKVPTEWIPLRKSGKICSAKVSKVASVDYLGRWGREPIAFEAKHTYQDRIRFDRIEAHQADFLKDWADGGQGIAFVLIGFSMKRFFVIPWFLWETWLKTYRSNGRPASISLMDLHHNFRQYEATQTSRAVIDYLEPVEKGWRRREFEN